MNETRNPRHATRLKCLCRVKAEKNIGCKRIMYKNVDAQVRKAEGRVLRVVLQREGNENESQREVGRREEASVKWEIQTRSGR